MNFLKHVFLVLINKRPGDILKKSKGLSDTELIAEIVATNNTLLFGTLYDRYSKKVYNRCYTFSRNDAEAKDLAQDVFLKLFTKLSSFKGNSKFSTWLYSFTYNFCVNYVRRDQNRKMSDRSDPIDDHEYYLDDKEDVDEKVFFEMKASKLERALKIIAPEDKSLLLLKYQDDVSIKDLQELLQVGESAIKMRLKRARLKLIDIHNSL